MMGGWGVRTGPEVETPPPPPKKVKVRRGPPGPYPAVLADRSDQKNPKIYSYPCLFVPTPESNHTTPETFLIMYFVIHPHLRRGIDWCYVQTDTLAGAETIVY